MSDDIRGAASPNRLKVRSCCFGVWTVAAATAALHLAVAERYDVFGNELYFIVCGRHPDFGHVDQPPLVPCSPRRPSFLGDNIWLLRFTSVIAVAALPPVKAALARLLGADAMAQLVAAAGAGLAPALAGFTGILTTFDLRTVA
jgi:hypothetical protein